MSRHAQLTMFILLGLLVLAAIIIVTVLLTSEKSKPPLTEETLTRTQMQPIKDYVESCLAIVADDALARIGAQGFALYASEGGTIPDSNREGVDYVRYEGHKVRTLIRLEPENTIEENGKIIISNSLVADQEEGDTTVLAYPWVTFPKDPFSGKTTTYLSSGFGWNLLPPLQQVQSHSVVGQLEAYLRTNMPKCVKWERFPLFHIETEEPRVQVIFTEASTIITMHWVVRARDEAGREGVIDTFITSRPVRLSAIHSFINYLIDNDVNNASFDIHHPAVPFQVFIERNYSSGSVIRIVDPRSSITERPYEVRFARENRPPALLFVNQAAISATALGNCIGANVSFEEDTFHLMQGSSSCALDLHLPLSAIDPDEENVVLSIDGPRGIPYVIRSTDLASPFPCIPYTIRASDGSKEDWQRINLRLIEKQFAPTCTT